MYRYEVFYDSGDINGSSDAWICLTSDCYNSLEYTKRKARQICKDFGGCHGVATMFYIHSVNNKYDVGYKVYTSRIY